MPMIVPPAPMNFFNALPLTDFVNPPTQAARLELLVGLATFVHAAITTPFMAQSMIVKFVGASTTNTLIFQQRVNVYTRKFRMRFAKAAVTANYTGATQEPNPITLKSPTGDGVTMQIQSPFDHGQVSGASFPPGITCQCKAMEGSNNDVAGVPAANLDRLVRQTNTALYTAPNFIEFEVDWCIACTPIPILTGDTQ